jgi:transposase-like protein
MENKYLARSHISEAKFRQVVRLFCEDLTATQIAELSGLNRKTVNRILLKIRRSIACYCEATSPLSGEVEIDESYFGPRRVRGMRGRGAGKKIIVFGLLKRQGKVYTQIVPNVSRETLKQIVQAKVEPESTIYSDGWRSYDGLVDWGYKKHYRVNHGQNEFARGNSHINGIENFWGVAKVRLAKFRGLRKEYFNLHLKECEYRYNMRNEDMYHELLKILRKDQD